MNHHDEPPKLMDVSIQQIRLPQDRPRRVLDQGMVGQMMQSLATVGQMQPVGVRRAGQSVWILVFGYVRFKAASELGWQTIRALEYPAMQNPELIDLALWASQNLHHAAPALDEMTGAVLRLSEAGMAVPAIAMALGRAVDWVQLMLSIARDPLARRLIDSGRLVEAEAWQMFMGFSASERKTFLDSAARISVQNCETFGLEPVLTKPAMSRMQAPLRDTRTRDLWSESDDSTSEQPSGQSIREEKHGCASPVR